MEEVPGFILRFCKDNNWRYLQQVDDLWWAVAPKAPSLTPVPGQGRKVVLSFYAEQAEVGDFCTDGPPFLDLEFEEDGYCKIPNLSPLVLSSDFYQKCPPAIFKKWRLRSRPEDNSSCIFWEKIG